MRVPVPVQVDADARDIPVAAHAHCAVLPPQPVPGPAEGVPVRVEDGHQVPVESVQEPRELPVRPVPLQELEQKHNNQPRRTQGTPNPEYLTVPCQGVGTITWEGPSFSGIFEGRKGKKNPSVCLRCKSRGGILLGASGFNQLHATALDQ